MEEKRRDSTSTPPPYSAGAEANNSENPTSRRRGGAQKRKLASLNSGGGSSNSQTTSKRQAREKPHVVPFPTIHMNGPCTRARVQPNSSNSFSSAEVSVKREVEVREAAAKAKAEELSRMNENWEALEAKIEAEFEAIRSREENVHVVPVHAGWFSWEKIHPLENKMLPSFFSGKSEDKTPEMYLEIRNWILKKFHLNPKEQIEVKDLSELTVGKLEDRQEVMDFLDYWGLINYHPFPKSEPAPMHVDADAKADETQKPDPLIEKLFQFETVQPWTPMVSRVNTSAPAVSSGLFPESVVADELVKSEGPSVEYHCNSCQADCSRKRYHCQKQADFDLCAECFNNGKFDADMSPSDFILMEPAEAGGVNGGSWTDQETILLLEAIEIFKDNWSEIAEHVATKTKAQCILHFVQMPIEDAFFDCDNENNAAHEENGLPVSIITEDSAPKVKQEDRDIVLKDVPEKTESQGEVTDNQDSSCPMEISKRDDADESNKSVEAREDFALKALKDAFEAVGASPLPGEKFSFAEAGNPVMALAAFLVRLVEPNTATASVRSLLKSLSAHQTSEHLAARHCFRLEDPPSEKKLNDLEKAATETIHHNEAQKLEDEQVESKNGETTSVVDGISLRDDVNDENKDSPPIEHTGKSDSTSESKKAKDSLNTGVVDKSDNMKGPDGMTTPEEDEPASMSEPQDSDVPKELSPKDAEESVTSASKADPESNSGKESEDGALAEENSQSKESLKDEEMQSNSGNKETELLAISDSLKEKTTNAADPKAEECGMKKSDTLTTKNDDINKLKRAALTTLSAAAVKAKFLADQEEDEIRQLTTLLVEKQLHKLETKLGFFNDMENVVIRVKEQLDRSKQRLFQERAQIIATRFGMSASARPMSQSLPSNRAAVNFPNPASRPGMVMNSLRPPMSRPLMAPNQTSSSFVPPNAAGSSMPPNADKPFPVGTK